MGGTAQAKSIAAQLHGRGVPLLYCQRENLSDSDYPFSTRIGGFAEGDQLSSVDGLSTLIDQHHVQCVVDATHPYASHISGTAAEVVARHSLLGLSLTRPPWQAHAEDNWRGFDSWADLLSALEPYQRPFITAGGSLSEQIYSQDSSKQWTLRVAPGRELKAQPNITLIEALGPFSEMEERDLFERYRFDVLVSKNSGGHWTANKLKIARELRIPVMMLRRPNKPLIGRAFDDVEALTRAVLLSLA